MVGEPRGAVVVCTHVVRRVLTSRNLHSAVGWAKTNIVCSVQGVSSRDVHLVIAIHRLRRLSQLNSFAWFKLNVSSCANGNCDSDKVFRNSCMLFYHISLLPVTIKCNILFQLYNTNTEKRLKYVVTGTTSNKNKSTRQFIKVTELVCRKACPFCINL